MLFDITPEDDAFRLAARHWLMQNVPAEPAPHSGQPAREFARPGWHAATQPDGAASAGRRSTVGAA